MSKIYLVASVFQTIAFAVYLFKGEIAIANTNLILAILMLNLFTKSKEKVSELKRDKDGTLYAVMNGKDLEIVRKTNSLRDK